jgi:hypothetical protein
MSSGIKSDQKRVIKESPISSNHNPLTVAQRFTPRKREDGTIGYRGQSATHESNQYRHTQSTSTMTPRSTVALENSRTKTIHMGFHPSRQHSERATPVRGYEVNIIYHRPAYHLDLNGYTFTLSLLIFAHSRLRLARCHHEI